MAPNCDFAWHPTPAWIENAELTRFQRLCGVPDFAALHQLPVAEFTARVLEFLRINFRHPFSQVLDLERGIAWPRWCVDGRLNIVDTCLQHPGDRTAVVHETESGAVVEWTYAQLSERTAAWAHHFRTLGLAKGDAIGLFLPMSAEMVAVTLAVNAIGAIAVPLFSGFGAGAIAARLADLEAKALVTSRGFHRRGKFIDTLATARDVPGIQHLIVVDDVVLENAPLEIADTSAEDTALVIYTSGTTGKPKGIVHTHCGLPVKCAQDMALDIDVHAGERVCWITDLGWVMGPWLVYGALILGATVCLYDGAPDFPAPDRLWAFCARNRINVLGLSPTLIRALQEHGSDLPQKHDLSALRVLASTGEPWNPDPWWWLFKNVGQSKLPIINYSGGTECGGGILVNHVTMPIKPCGFAGPCAGMHAAVFDEQGQPAPPGAVGELVITQPWIGQARGFWRDPDRYEDTYWRRFPGIWVHGDWATVDEDGHWFVLGRSDDTLKIAGKRVGPAEVESVLVDHAAVTEAAVIGVPDDLKGSKMLAFCRVTADGHQLAAELREHVARAMGKALRPDGVYFVSQLPKTRNGKIMRRVIRAAWLGESPGDTTALDNPGALDEIRQLTKGA